MRWKLLSTDDSCVPDAERTRAHGREALSFHGRAGRHDSWQCNRALLALRCSISPLPSALSPSSVPRSYLDSNVTDGVLGEVELEWRFWNMLEAQQQRLASENARQTRRRRYDTLHLRVLHAQPLPPLGPQHRAAFVAVSTAGAELRTRAVPAAPGRDLHEFGEEFDVDLSAHESELLFRVWCSKPAGGADAFLGEGRWDVLALPTDSGEQRVRLGPALDEFPAIAGSPRDLGSVLVSWYYSNAADRKALEAASVAQLKTHMRHCNCLTVEVRQARGLRAPDGGGGPVRALAVLSHGPAEGTAQGEGWPLVRFSGDRLTCELTTDHLRVLVTDRASGGAPVGWASMDLGLQDRAGEEWVPLQPFGHPQPYRLVKGYPCLGEVLLAWQLGADAALQAQQSAQQQQLQRMLARSNLLHVWVYRAELAARAPGSRLPDPYARVHFGTQAAQATALAHQQLDPIWLERLTFQVSPLDTEPLCLDVWDGGRERFLGRARLTVPSGAEEDTWQGWVPLLGRERDDRDWLQAVQCGGATGRVCLGWQFLNQHQRAHNQRAKVASYRGLRIDVLEAHEAPQAANGRQVAVAVRWGAAQARQTRAVSGADLRWGESFDFALKDLEETLHVQLMDCDRHADVDFLGEGVLDVGGEAADGGERWVFLWPRPGNARDRAKMHRVGGFGELRLRWQYVGAEPGPERLVSSLDEAAAWAAAASLALGVTVHEADGLAPDGGAVAVALGFGGAPGVQTEPMAPGPAGAVHWDEQFELDAAPGRVRPILDFTVLRILPDGATAILGVAEHRLHAPSADPLGHELWLTLQRPDKARRIVDDMPLYGRLRVTVALHTAAARAAAEERRCEHRAAVLRGYTTLHVVVVEAAGLPVERRHAFASLLFGGTRGWTEAQAVAPRVLWGTDLTFDLAQPELDARTQGLLTVWDPAALNTPEEIIGEAVVDFCGSGGDSAEVWCVLEPRGADAAVRARARNRKERGRVQLQWRLANDPIKGIRQKRLREQRQAICKQCDHVVVEVCEGRGLSLSTRPADGAGAVFAVCAYGGAQCLTRTLSGASPAWGSVFTFGDVRPDARLQVMVLERTPAGPVALVGYAALDIAESGAADGEAWVQLRTVPQLEADMKRVVLQGHSDLGEVRVRWGFVAAAEMAQRTDAKLGLYSALEVEVVEAAGLTAAAEVAGLANGVVAPFVAARLGAAAPEKCTPAVHSADCPRWDCALQFPVTGVGALAVSLRSPQGPLGDGTLDVLVEALAEGDRWFLLQPPEAGSGSLGHEANESPEKMLAAAQARPQGASVRLRWRFLTEDKLLQRQEALQARWQARLRQFSDVRIEVVGARDLPADLHLRPYCEVRWGPFTSASVPAAPSSSPVWDHTWDVELGTEPHTLRICVLGSNRANGPARALGEASVDLLSGEEAAGSQWLPLQLPPSAVPPHAAQQVAGEVCVRWAFSYDAQLTDMRAQSRAHRLAKLGRYQTLQLQIRGGQGLMAPKGSGHTQAFVVCTFGGFETCTPLAEAGVLDPQWGYTADLPVHAACDALRFAVWDGRTGHFPADADAFMGEGAVDVLGQRESAGAAAVPLGPREGGGVVALGSLHIQWEFLSDENRQTFRRRKPQKYNHLEVQLLEATGLAFLGASPAEQVVAQLALGPHKSPLTMPAYPVAGSAVAAWYRTMVFPVSDPNAKLTITLIGGQERRLLGNGGLDVAAEGLDLGERWVPLLSVASPRGTPAHVRVQWRYYDDTAAAARRRVRLAHFSSLCATVVEARGLPPPHALPYRAAVRLTGAKSPVVVWTGDALADPDPIWQETFRLDLTDVGVDGQVVAVEMWGGGNWFIGSAHVDAGAAEDDAGEAWLALGPRDDDLADWEMWHQNGRDVGQVKLRWAYANDRGEREARAAKVATYAALRLRVRAGRDVPDRGGCYVQAAYGDGAGETTVAYGAGNPQWDWQEDLPVSSVADRLRLALRAHGTSGAGSLLGEAVVDPAVEPAAEGEAWCPLDATLERPATTHGHLHVTWRYMTGEELEAETAARAARRAARLRDFTHVELRLQGARDLVTAPGAAVPSVAAQVCYGPTDVWPVDGAEPAVDPRWPGDPHTLPLHSGDLSVALWGAGTDGAARQCLGQTAWDVLAAETAAGEVWLPLAPPAGAGPGPRRYVGEVQVGWRFCNGPAEKARRLQRLREFAGVVVELLEAQELARAAPQGVCAAAVRLGQTCQLLHAAGASSAPVWKDPLYFDLSDPDAELRVTLRDRAPDADDAGRCIGEARLDLLLEAPEGEAWVQLRGRPGVADDAVLVLRHRTLGAVRCRWTFVTADGAQATRQEKLDHSSTLALTVARARLPQAHGAADAFVAVQVCAVSYKRTSRLAKTFGARDAFQSSSALLLPRRREGAFSTSGQWSTALPREMCSQSAQGLTGNSMMPKAARKYLDPPPPTPTHSSGPSLPPPPSGGKTRTFLADAFMNLLKHRTSRNVCRPQACIRTAVHRRRRGGTSPWTPLPPP